jgi:HSP20 family protein
MAIIRRRSRDEWDPFSWLSDFRSELDNVFVKSLVPRRAAAGEAWQGNWLPAVDVMEDKEKITVKADLPGLKKDEIDISLNGDILTITGEKKSEEEIKEKNYYRAERYYGTFRRSIVLPASVQEGKIKASYKEGVLQVELPRKKETRGKKIRIEG